MKEMNHEKSENDGNSRDLGLYIHVPFCIKKCDYCDFLSAPASTETMKQYFDAVLTEIDQYRENTGNYIVRTIFFGGGTPSVPDAAYIEKLMREIFRIFRVDMDNLEATIEVNPGTLTRDKLLTYKNIGINRLSFGLQSADNKELKLLGRIHTYEQFLANYYLARELGFNNINVDLMSALPGQNVSAWEYTLNKVIELEPEHISAYSLIIEEGTKFYEVYRKGAEAADNLPDEETDRLIYHKTKEILKNSGYHRYEISNYAKDAYECRHNSSYWTGTDYLGIGLGASSLLYGARFSNMHDIEQYISQCNEYRERRNSSVSADESIPNDLKYLNDKIGLRCNIEHLLKEQRMEEFMFLGLRMCCGISKYAFYHRFGIEIEKVYKDVLERLSKQKLLEICGDNIKLTEYGIDISNYVLSEFLLD
jgi:oxygen-independent coproporphyrinogen-3 oxidase